MHPVRPAAGFVLVMVLALLVVLALLAGMVAARSSQLVEEAQAQLDQFDAERDMLSTRDTLLFMLATQRLTLGGLTVGEYVPPAQGTLNDPDALMLPVGDEIRLDSTPYRGLGGTFFSLQDDRGLLSINWGAPLLRESWLARRGASPADQLALADKRRDYQDADQLRRLDGAEAEEYAAADLPPPANRPLSTPLELRRILGWRELLAPLDDAQVLRSLSLARAVDINLNTAPAEVLAAIPGMSPAEAERLLALRQQAPLLSMLEFHASFPVPPLIGEALNLFTSQSGSITLWGGHDGPQRLVHWTLTPIREGGPPWRIDYEVTLPRGSDPAPDLAQRPASPLFGAPDPD